MPYDQDKHGTAIHVDDYVFWRDAYHEENNSGVGRIKSLDGPYIHIAMITGKSSGNTMRALPREIALLDESDIVGVDLTGKLLFWNADYNQVFTDGSTPETYEGTPDSEELMRIEATQ